ncbi:MAG: 3-methyl-2-oxobutanoate dehydrogenase subunit VorB [Candidatus Omnitrophica bacterium 4484_70.1]|nr:MAG: 3-methyl-2-oxobutanoate dehydrogenase subunit VorB [Candidatus Omnitrophica bacterium 4484_70.1]
MKELKNKKILMSGNEAMGEAAIKAGCQFYAGYPITPQNELTAYMAKRMNEEKRIFIQAESEVAAINMVFGSLKQEGISYLCGCELPCVIINVMRGGPGLGNIAPSQADYFQATKGGGHGDYHLIVLAPSSVQEAFELVCLAFDLADKYRNPVMILSDAFLGQMVESIQITDCRLQITNYRRGWALTGAKGRNPNIIRSLFLQEGALERHNQRLQDKYRVIEENEVRYEAIDCEEAEVIFVAYGISFRIAKEAALILERKGIKVGLFRPITLWPFPYNALKERVSPQKKVFVFELSSGQMKEDVILAIGEKCPLYFYGRIGGGVFTEREIVDFVTRRGEFFLKG